MNLKTTGFYRVAARGFAIITPLYPNRTISPVIVEAPVVTNTEGKFIYGNAGLTRDWNSTITLRRGFNPSHPATTLRYRKMRLGGPDHRLFGWGVPPTPVDGIRHWGTVANNPIATFTLG